MPPGRNLPLYRLAAAWAKLRRSAIDLGGMLVPLPRFAHPGVP